VNPMIAIPATETSKFRYRRMQWRMLFAVMFCYAFYYTGRQNFGWATAALIKELGFAPVAVAMINGGMLLSYGLGQAINGRLGDTAGARRLMPLGAVLSCGLNWTVSFAQSFPWLLAGWSLNGYAQSLGFASGGRLITNWWNERERGRAFGLYLLAAGSSSAITYGLSIWALNSFGWRYIFRIPVLFLLVAGVVFAIVARDTPESAGFAARPPSSPGAAELTSKPAGWITRYAQLARNRKYLFACLTAGFESAARYGLLAWTPLAYLGADWKRSPESLWITLALPAGMAVGAWTCGYISDCFFGCNRSKPIALFLTCAAVSSGLLFALPARDAGAGMVLLFLSGFFVFGPQSSLWALCPDLLGQRRAATSIGVMDACAYAFASASEPLYGFSIHLFGAIPIVFLFTAVLCALGALCSLAVDR